MKCYNCKKNKDVSNFSKNSSRPTGYNSQCKECHKEYRRSHYLKNKDKYIQKAKLNREKFRKWFIEFKSKLKCKNCGENRHWVLDFHHKKNKDVEVSKLVGNCSKKRILEEINKCEVLCANCHRDYHYHN